MHVALVQCIAILYIHMRGRRRRWDEACFGSTCISVLPSCRREGLACNQGQARHRADAAHDSQLPDVPCVFSLGLNQLTCLHSNTTTSRHSIDATALAGTGKIPRALYVHSPKGQLNYLLNETFLLQYFERHTHTHTHTAHPAFSLQEINQCLVEGLVSPCKHTPDTSLYPSAAHVGSKRHRES